MFEREIYHLYQLYCEQRFRLGGYEAFTSQGSVYLIEPSTPDKKAVDWVNSVGHFLEKEGENVARLVPTATNRWDGNIEGNAILLYKLQSKRIKRKNRKNRPIGRRLARIHSKGYRFLQQYNSSMVIEPWNIRWEKRLDQLEQWYFEVIKKKKKDRFDEMFVRSFPYYLGLGENAIQYIVDAEIDTQENFFQNVSLTHNRFTNESWISFRDETFIVPSRLLVDHPMRDIAEWIRQETEMKQDSYSRVSSFISEYNERKRMTYNDWRLLFARLLFPINYIEAVEEYYSNPNIQVKNRMEARLEKLLRIEGERERFLAEFLPNLLGVDSQNLRSVDWLSL
ncbi:spore coat putative kinase YutH [Pseudalkalibacillus caeni]|uniref:Spore coat protein YutH n=1 Tax=Exobacillus caeni TaxID=2574798 RepID=A0A5R9FE37_9BACL|nr:spore coat protein YutH [Pseudalkalibacillus caeni]TLS38834.1 spore coat protein YutH [Pseudalkalibacillus caeni]